MTQTSLSPVVRHIRRLAGADPAGERSDTELLERFVADREEGAFAALLRRHGPLVWSVCWQVLHHRQDAEDAFQATFLLLARQAGSIRKTEAVASWLCRVAYRVAKRAGQNMARRRGQERQVEERQVSRPEAEAAWRELQAVLNEELERLPEKYRAPFIMCCLEGKSGPQAARQLGWKVGTVTGRLTEARKLLQHRLARRGVLLSSVLITTAVSCEGAAAASVTLAPGTVKAALAWATQATAAGMVSARVAGLVEAMAQKVFVTKLKAATAVLLAASALAGAGAMARQALGAKEAPPPAQKAETATKPEAKPQSGRTQPTPDAKDKAGDTIEVSGRVLDPAGKPAAGAKIYLAHHLYGGQELAPGCSRVRATTGDDGRFHFRTARPALGQPEADKEWFNATITAVAASYGPAWAAFYKPEPLANLTLKLVQDDVPIQGRVVDLEGNPIQGATVRVLQVTPMAKEDLKPWLEEVQKTKERWNPIYRYRGTSLDAAIAGLTTSVTTGADGKFRLTGVGRERLAGLRIEGPTIETVDVYAMTRPGSRITVPRERDMPEFGNEVYYGARFDHAAAPTMPIVGTVRDKDTGQPIAGVTVQSRIPAALIMGLYQLRTTTDREGRYRLVGLPKQSGHPIQIVPPTGIPYLTSVKTTTIPRGLEPLQMDFDLKRGVLIRGQVTDKATGRPVRAQVDYFALVDNPHLRDVAGFRGSGGVSAFTAEDGSFTLVGLPGPGIVAAKVGRRDVQGTPDEKRYVAASGADDIKGPRQDSHFTTDPFFCAAPLYHTLVGINPENNAESITCNVSLDPGKTVTGKVVGPDAKPVAGVQMTSVWGLSRQQELKSPEFTVRAIDPKRPLPFFFHHKDKQLGAAVLLKGDEPKDFTVRLQPCATITGRIVDEDGQPRAGLRVMGFIESGQLNIAEGWGGEFGGETDKNGRFEIRGVIPALKVSAYTYKGAAFGGLLFKDLTFQAGETKKLGEVHVKPNE